MDRKREWAGKLLLGLARARVGESKGFGGVSLARELGIPLSTVETQLAGTRPVSVEVMRAIGHRWPDLLPLATKIIMSPVSELDQVIEEAQCALNGVVGS